MEIRAQPGPDIEPFAHPRNARRFSRAEASASCEPKGSEEASPLGARVS